MRQLDTGDIQAAIRGYQMADRTKDELRALADAHRGDPRVKAQLIAEAARRCAAAGLYRRAVCRGSSVALALLMLVSCAGRAPDPVAVSQPQDTAMSCPAIRAEVQANQTKIDDLETEGNWKVAQNVDTDVAGLLIWPLWFGMDWQGAAGTDQAALEQRNAYLGTIAADRCGGE